MFIYCCIVIPQVARLNEKMNDLENKLKQKDHELEMITSQVDEDVTTRTRSLQEDLKKSEEQRRNTEELLLKVQRELSTVQQKANEDQVQLSKQVKNAIWNSSYRIQYFLFCW